MEVLTFAGLPTVLFLDTPTAAQRGAVRRISRHRDRRRGPVADARTGWTAHLPPVFQTHGSAEGSDCTLQGLLDLRLGTACRVDRAGDRSRGSYARRRLASARRRGSPRSGATRSSATCSPSRTASVTGSTGIRPCPATRSRRWTRRMSASTSQKQTDKAIGLVDYLALKRGEADTRLKEERAEGAEIVAIDVARRRDARRGRSTGLGKPRRPDLRRRLAGPGDMRWSRIGGPQACSIGHATSSGPPRSSGSSAFPVRARR